MLVKCCFCLSFSVFRVLSMQTYTFFSAMQNFSSFFFTFIIKKLLLVLICGVSYPFFLTLLWQSVVQQERADKRTGYRSA